MGGARHHGKAKQASASAPSGRIFDLKPLSRFKRRGPEGRPWCWEEYVTFGRITAIHASAKAGKSTFLTLLFKALEDGAMFCDRRTAKARILLLSEEHEEEVTERTDLAHLSDNVIDQAVPFMGKPDWPTWERAIDELCEKVSEKGGHWLVVLDTVIALWPIEEENSNGEMGKCLMPLRKLSEAVGAAVLLVHHGETKLRGATAFEGFADTIITLEPGPDEPDQRVRTVKAKGRASQTPRKMIVRLPRTAGATRCWHGSGAKRSQRRTYVKRWLRWSAACPAGRSANCWPRGPTPQTPARAACSMPSGVSSSRQRHGSGGKVKA